MHTPGPQEVQAAEADYMADRWARPKRCPECGGPLVYSDGRAECPVCGFSEEGRGTTMHTSGPWTVNHDQYHICAGAVAVAAVFGSMGHDAERSKANARLIAQAPELKAENERLTTINSKLLEALEETRDELKQLSDELAHGRIGWRAIATLPTRIGVLEGTILAAKGE